jgi:hypothetical protein
MKLKCCYLTIFYQQVKGIGTTYVFGNSEPPTRRWEQSGNLILRRWNISEKSAKLGYVIGFVIIFGILVAVPFLVRGIAFLVT